MDLFPLRLFATLCAQFKPLRFLSGASMSEPYPWQTKSVRIIQMIANW